jgi:hypothetical protein
MAYIHFFLIVLIAQPLFLLSFSSRIFQIGERWADERTLALCMSNGGYVNNYVMNAFIKMILNDQKMKDKCSEKIACLKHITSTETTVSLLFLSSFASPKSYPILAFFMTEYFKHSTFNSF